MQTSLCGSTMAEMTTVTQPLLGRLFDLWFIVPSRLSVLVLCVTPSGGVFENAPDME